MTKQEEILTKYAYVDIMKHKLEIHLMGKDKFIESRIDPKLTKKQADKVKLTYEACMHKILGTECPVL